MTESLAADALVSTHRVAARLEGISAATSWFGDVADEQDWPAALRFGLELSLEEALTNVISYGFVAVDHEPDIRVECYRLPAGRVALRIVDNGVAFDPTSVAEPEVPASVDDARIGGHGVQLMRHFLETLSYERVGEENRLTLVAAPSGD